MLATNSTGGEIMSNETGGHLYEATPKKPKEQSISEIIQNNRADESCGAGQVNLRDLLIQRTMARHGFTEEQALAVILAFGGS